MSKAEVDSQSSAVLVSVDEPSRAKFAAVTGQVAMAGGTVAVLLDGRVLLAASVNNGPISSGRIEVPAIDPQELEALSSALHASATK